MNIGEERIPSETQTSTGWALPLPCSLSDILTMSCKSRAEAFARKLSTRLKSLGGSQDDHEQLVDEEEGASAASEQDSVISESPRQSVVFVHNPRVVTVGINSTTGNLLFVKQRGDDGEADQAQTGYDTVGLNGISTLDLTPPQDSDAYFDFDIASPEYAADQDTAEYAINNADNLSLSPEQPCSSPPDELSLYGNNDPLQDNVASAPVPAKHKYSGDDSEASEISVYFDADSSVDLSDFPSDNNCLRPTPISESSSHSDSDGGVTPTNQNVTPEPSDAAVAEGEESAYGSRSSSTAHDLLVEEQALFLNPAERQCATDAVGQLELKSNQHDSSAVSGDAEEHLNEKLLVDSESTSIEEAETNTDTCKNCKGSKNPDFPFTVPVIEESLIQDFSAPFTPQSSPTVQERCLCSSPDSLASDTPVEPPCPSPLIEADSKEHSEACLCAGKVHESHQSRKSQYEKHGTSDNEERMRLRRSSSLKSGKTPPGTPGRKKIVRFADCLGLDLADVRTFLDEIPNIPKSAYEYLEDEDMMMISTNTNQRSQPFFTSDPASPLDMRPPHAYKAIVPMFQQPGGFPTFLDRIKEFKVSLENVMVCEDLSLKGTARVLNMDFHKSVFVRYTLDNWHTWNDLHGAHVAGSCDGLSDQFQFTLYATSCLEIGQRILFAICYQTLGQQFWDNNNGQDYCIQCFSH